MRVVYQGVPGSYSHVTYKKNKKYFSKKITKVQGFNTYEDVWESIDEKTIAILPFENSYVGNIRKNYAKYIEKMEKYTIIGEVMVQPESCLLSKEENLEEVKHVYSSPVGLEQCQKFIKKHKLQTHEYLDPAMAAEAISLGIKEHGAAIASKYAAVEYKLNILAENIQDQSDNVTRFLIITHKKARVTFEQKRNKLSLHFTLKHGFQDFGHLFRIFDVYKANVVKMNLYPTGEQAFEQSVCMDVEFGEMINEHQSCIEKISEYCSHIHVLGVY